MSKEDRGERGHAILLALDAHPAGAETPASPRLAGLVVPGLPHHVTQRGVRSTRVFRSDSDRELYLSLMAGKTECFGVTVLAWCLMPG